MTLAVLLIEDMKPIQSALVELFTANGVSKVVGIASTEAEANLWLHENPGKWDLAVVDLVLEQGTGMRVIANARKASDSAHIVVFSDFATAGIEAHCRKLGANAIFDKSQGLAQLLAYFAKLADSKRLRSA